MTFLLVHGAWHGGWCWSEVADRLRAGGAHDVRTVTLTGLGERAGELSRDVDLDTHVRDVVDAIERPDLTDVVLVGHSYAGMVVVNAAARLGPRVRELIVLDGFVPAAGERAIDLLPSEKAAYYRDSAEQGDGWTVPPRPLAALGVTDPRVLAAHPLLTRHPYRTYVSRSPHGAAEVTAPATFLLCAGWDTPFRPHAERAEALGWARHDLVADHQIILSDPDLLAAHLLKAA